MSWDTLEVEAVCRWAGQHAGTAWYAGSVLGCSAEQRHHDNLVACLSRLAFPLSRLGKCPVLPDKLSRLHIELYSGHLSLPTTTYQVTSLKVTSGLGRVFSWSAHNLAGYQNDEFALHRLGLKGC